MALESVSSLLKKADASRSAGDRESAIAALQQAVALDPRSVPALGNLGMLLYERGKVKEAVALYEKALGIDPGYAEVRCNLGTALLGLGNIEAAEQAFTKALESNRNFFEALFNLASIRHYRNDLKAARTLYCEALRIRPNEPVAHFRLGTILREWNRPDLAAACYKNALRFRPCYPLALMNLGEALQVMGMIEESKGYLTKATELEEDNDLAWSNLLLSMNYDPALSPLEIFKAHCAWGERAAHKTAAGAVRIFPNSPAGGRPLRIGYVSADFCRHPAASFLEPLLKCTDRSAFEPYCYSHGRTVDAATARFKRYAAGWRDIAEVSDDEAEAAIRADGIDILVDCTGHMADNRLPLFARRCAPVQVSWIGYPNTTGLTAVDYRFTDDIVDPPAGPALFTEELIRLENGFCCFQPPDAAPPVTPPPCGKRGFVTFGSLHNLARLNRSVISVWSQTLLQVPASRLVIFRNTLNVEIIERFSMLFKAEGIGVDRIDFVSEVPAAGHLAMYDRIDIALDTWPWSGHTTACEALWMGVPVITLRGNRHAGRMAASVLTRLGLQSCIAGTPEDFFLIAKRLSNDPASLAKLRSGLRETMRASPLCDGPSFTRAVEREYRKMWKKWCELQQI